MKIDQKNKKILSKIQENGKISNNELSETVGMPATTIFERIKKMEKEGIVKGYKAVLDANKIRLGLTAFVFIRTSTVNFDDVLVDRIRRIPFVLELHEMAGECSYLAKVCATDTVHLAEILKDYFGKIDGITNTNTHIVLNTNLDNGSFPISEI